MAPESPSPGPPNSLPAKARDFWCGLVETPRAQRLRIGREGLSRAPALTYSAGRYSEPLERLSTAFMLRVYRQRLPEVGDGLLAPSLGLEEMAPVSVGYGGVARINRDGLAVVGDSAVVVSFVLVREPRLL